MKVWNKSVCQMIGGPGGGPFDIWQRNFDPTKDGGFIEQLSECQLLKKISVYWISSDVQFAVVM